MLTKYRHVEDAHHAHVGHGQGGMNTNDEITEHPAPRHETANPEPKEIKI